MDLSNEVHGIDHGGCLMKNTVLKLSAFFFSAVLFISLFPATPSLAYTVSGRCGESLTRIGESNGIWLIREFGTMF